MRRLYDLTKLEVGKRYFVQLGIWQGNVLYCGECLDGKRKKLRFTFGSTVESWKDNMNLVGSKSNFKVFVIDK